MLAVAAAAIRKNRQETEERRRRREEERKTGREKKREEEERQIAEEQTRKAELVTELIGNWEEAMRLRRFVKAIEEKTVRSDFSPAERNDIQQVADWTRAYADSPDPLCDLPEAIEESVGPESKYLRVE